MTTTPELPTVCAALGDQTRWEILIRLGDEAMSASALARVLPVSRQAIGKHLDVLAEVGLVTSERRGREVVYVAVGARMSALARQLEHVGRSWETRLLGIKELAEKGPDGPARRGAAPGAPPSAGHGPRVRPR